MATQRKVDITVDEKIFRQMLHEQQYAYTRDAVRKAFDAWRKANEQKIQSVVMKYLDKELPALIAKELPKLRKDFYCGFG